MDAGVERIVDQVVNPKIRSLVEPEVKRIINAYLGEENLDDEGEYILVEGIAILYYFNGNDKLISFIAICTYLSLILMS